MEKETKNKKTGFFAHIDMHQFVISILIVIIVIGMGIFSPYFFTLGNLEALLNSFVLEAIMALGMTLVIISGGIDLSISGILPFSAIIFALLIKNDLHFILAGGIVLVISAGIGLLNNFLRKTFNIHSFIVTLATMLFFKGLNLALTDGKVLSKFPENFSKFLGYEVIGIALPVFIFLVLAGIYLIYLKHNKFFLKIYFVGGNYNAALFSGINTEKVLAFVYMQSALLAGLAGLLATNIYNSASSTFGQGAELRVITAVAIGGTSLTRGGVGNIGGTLLGTLFLALTYNVFLMSGISTYYQDVVTGAMLILAIAISEQAKKIDTPFVKNFKGRVQRLFSK